MEAFDMTQYSKLKRVQKRFAYVTHYSERVKTCIIKYTGSSKLPYLLHPDELMTKLIIWSSHDEYVCCVCCLIYELHRLC